MEAFNKLPESLRNDCLDAKVSKGECLALESRSLEIVQPNQGGMIDILWIVDNSASMAEEQQALGSNFESFIDQLALSGLDFQTAVTSTDTCDAVQPTQLELVMCPSDDASLQHQGRFMGLPGQTVLNASTPNLTSLFSDYTNIGTNGSVFEHGLTAAKMGIAKSLSGENETLVRDGAFLSVIVLSDEEDDGIGLQQTDQFSGINYYEQGLTTFKYTDDDFLAYLRSIKPDGQFSVSAITGTIDPRTGQLCQSTRVVQKNWDPSTLKQPKKQVEASTPSAILIGIFCSPNSGQI